MIHLLVTFLLTISASLHGSHERDLLAGDVSPAAPKNSSSSIHSGITDGDAEDTGEVDEDIIITDDEDTQDDEGVNN